MEAMADLPPDFSIMVRNVFGELATGDCGPVDDQAGGDPVILGYFLQSFNEFLPTLDQLLEDCIDVVLRSRIGAQQHIRVNVFHAWPVTANDRVDYRPKSEMIGQIDQPYQLSD